MNLNSFSPAASSDVPTGAKNVLTNDVEVRGTLKFTSELIFDGKLDGEIVSDGGVLTLGKNAQVKGEVRTKSVTVHGTVEGNITVTERCELKASSQLTGDLKATRIVIEEGATFVGKSEVTPTRPTSRETSATTEAPRPTRGNLSSAATTATSTSSSTSAPSSSS